jgi:CCR4-NOT transcription complex subunit 3
MDRSAKILKLTERHKHHQTRLEIILRMLDNGNLSVQEVILAGNILISRL